MKNGLILVGPAMNKQYSPAVLGLAERNGVGVEELPAIINGCSGGFSKFYWLAFNRACSCEVWCELHDLRYYIGGDKAARLYADKELRRGAKNAGKPVPGWLAAMRLQFPKTALLFCWVPAVRKAWRWLRAWAMYAAVRAFGWCRFRWG